MIDVQEMSGANNRASTLLIYQYDVAGVSYEASQDVTYLRQLINLHSCRLGLPTSVRFDPRILEIRLCFRSAGWGCDSSSRTRSPGCESVASVPDRAWSSGKFLLVFGDVLRGGGIASVQASRESKGRPEHHMENTSKSSSKLRILYGEGDADVLAAQSVRSNRRDTK